MNKNTFIVIGIALVTTSCGSGDSRSRADTAAVSKLDSVMPAINTNNDRYVCGFTGSFAYTDSMPVAAQQSSVDDSIERTFEAIWRNVIGGRPDAIRIQKDADQNNTEYKYAAAKGSFSDLGNIVRYVFYKSNDLSPLLHRDNGWCLRAIALHEFSHHINSDTFTGVSRDVAELGADDYAGFMLGRSSLSTTLDTALIAFSTLTEEHPTNGYPDREKRMAAVKAGWERAQLLGHYTITSAFIAVIGTRHGIASNDTFLDFDNIKDAVESSGTLKTLNDTSTTGMAKVNIEASYSPGEFLVDSNYLYFKKTDSLSIVGRVVNSNRPEYRQMIYDNFYNYMYIKSDSSLVTYVRGLKETGVGKPIVIGMLSKRKR